MAELIEDTAGKIRDKPITKKLRDLLVAAAAAAGVERVRVTSGGQDAKGVPNARRTGSTRHDNGNAADLVLEKDGRALSFVLAGDLPIFELFVAAATARGATGIGAGVDYMGPRTLHVGFGSQATWGAGGKAANAPGWLVRAVQKGRSGAALPAAPQVVSDPSRKHYMVSARSGLWLRSEASTSSQKIRALPAGTRIAGTVDPADIQWVRADIEEDGLYDGYLFAAYLTEV